MDSSAGQSSTKAILHALQKAYNTNKASFKVQALVKADPPPGLTIYVRGRGEPLLVASHNWPKRQKSWSHLDRGSGLAGSLRDEMMQASDTQEYPSLIDTFWRTHTVDGVFPKDENRRIYLLDRMDHAFGKGVKLRGHHSGWVLSCIAITGHIQAKYARPRQVAQEHA
ncbi:hypothetical protein Tco_0729828 [Tanacetum coccineum]|uniref:Uncharacterized protein n=1 Tax=Tanacetum coccineum TaxID=301880 RepID=A0ABQ4YSS7_9ASTR